MSDSYAFRAVDSLGVKVKGEVESDSPEGVTELLKRARPARPGGQAQDQVG